MALDDTTRREVGRDGLAGGSVVVSAEDVLGPDDLCRIRVDHVLGDGNGLTHLAIVVEPANAGAVEVELDGALSEILIKGSIGVPWHTAFLSSACPGGAKRVEGGHDVGALNGTPRIHLADGKSIHEIPG